MPMQPRTEQVLSPQTDAADGARVCDVQATVLRIVHPTLRAVDLCDSPHLQELDLRDLDGREDLHLTVQGCPSLAWLRLPEQGRAFVHIDGGEQRPALRIDAQLVQLDACWHGGKFMLQAERNAHWRSARIGPLSGLPPQGAQDGPADTEEVRVVTGSTGGTSLVLTPSDGNRWRELLLIDLPELQQLRCDLPMQRLTISQAPALERFDLQAPVDTSRSAAASGWRTSPARRRPIGWICAAAAAPAPASRSTSPPARSIWRAARCGRWSCGSRPGCGSSSVCICTRPSWPPARGSGASGMCLCRSTWWRWRRSTTARSGGCSRPVPMAI